jgi:hypothetical protein
VKLAAAVAFKLADIDQAVALAASQNAAMQVNHRATPTAAGAGKPAAKPAMPVPGGSQRYLEHPAPKEIDENPVIRQV